MNFVGADPGRLHDLAVRLRAQSHELDGVTSVVDGLVAHGGVLLPSGLGWGDDWADVRASLVAIVEEADAWARRLVARAEGQPEALVPDHVEAKPAPTDRLDKPAGTASSGQWAGARDPRRPGAAAGLPANRGQVAA